MNLWAQLIHLPASSVAAGCPRWLSAWSSSQQGLLPRRCNAELPWGQHRTLHRKEARSVATSLGCVLVQGRGFTKINVLTVLSSSTSSGGGCAHLSDLPFLITWPWGLPQGRLCCSLIVSQSPALNRTGSQLLKTHIWVLIISTDKFSFVKFVCCYFHGQHHLVLCLWAKHFSISVKNKGWEIFRASLWARGTS